MYSDFEILILTIYVETYYLLCSYSELSLSYESTVYKSLNFCY